MTAFDLPRGSAYVVIICTTAIIWSLFVLFIRIFLRAKVNGPFGWDDVACGAATIIGIIQSCITLAAVHYGLGYKKGTFPESSLYTFELYVWIALMLYTVCLATSLLSVAFLICRITKFRPHLILTYCLAVTTGIWGLVSIGVQAFQLAHSARNHDFIHTSRIVPLKGVASSHLESPNAHQEQNQGVPGIRFEAAVRIIPALSARLTSVHAAVNGDDPTYDRVEVQIINQVVLHVSIYLATIPCAKPFFVVFEGGIFRSPSHPRQKDRPSFGSNPTSAGSGSAQPPNPVSWDRRTSFAPTTQPARPPLRQQHTPSSLKRYFPWQWGAEGASTPNSQGGGRLQTRMGSIGESMHGALPTDPSPGGSSTQTPTYPLPSLNISQRSLDEREGYSQHNESSRSSRVRRQSEYNWFDRLRMDEGSTVTTVRHDPDFAAAAARKRSKASEEIWRQKKHGILQTQSFTVDIEEVSGESNSRERLDRSAECP